jgi:HEAT repeat protein
VSSSDKAPEATALLKHSLSAKRRSGAKTLRKLQDPAAGPALLESLRDEVSDPRTWETQYQMIMALGACGYAPALPFLQELAGRRFDATMVYVAIGDALVRLATPENGRWKALMNLVQSGNEGLAYGACQAMAMLRLVPPAAVIEQLIEFANRFPLDESQGINQRFCIAAAAPGWLKQSAVVRPFLEVCTTSKNSQVKLAAESALQGKYRKWSPL